MTENVTGDIYTNEQDVFIRPDTGYDRDLDILGAANKHAAEYLQRMTGRPIAECMEHVITSTGEGGALELKPCKINVLRRGPGGDRVTDVLDVDKVLDYVTDTKSMLAPNFVVYDSPEKNKSCTGGYVERRLADRKVIKRRGLLAKQEGRMAEFSLANNSEASIKLLLNSLSGAHASPYNPHYNRTAHSTLTSNCRVLTSYANAVTERLISGNRHYFNRDVTLSSIITVITNTDYDRLERLITKYDIHYPTVTEVTELITRCTRLYWRDAIEFLPIVELVERLTPIERAAFVYTGDLYHLRKFNEELVIRLINDFITTTTVLDKDPETVVANAGEDIVALVGILCSDLLAGGTVRNLAETNPEGYIVYVQTVNHVNSMICKYGDLFNILLSTDNVPGNVFYFRDSIRRAVVGSDTDSTMFTVQEWVEWYFGKIIFTHAAYKVSNVICFINTQVIAHTLALASTQMGAIGDKTFKLKMKNEFSFPVYMKANRAKHYVTIVNSREGNVYKVPELDIKGVSLKDSKIPPFIIKGLHAEFQSLVDNITDKGSIDIYPLMQRVANTEYLINDSIDSGSIEYYSFVNINPADSYKKPMSSNYLHYDLWDKVFGDRYGEIGEPPYQAIKISVNLKNKVALANWATLFDIETRLKLTNWLDENNKTNFTMLLLPKSIMDKGLPPEFSKIVDKRNTIVELLAGAYIMLEICGFYYRNSNNTKMVYDEVLHRPATGIIGSTIKEVP